MASKGGQPGNTNAAKAKPWIAALERHFKQNPNKLAAIAEKVADAAAEGEAWAVQEIGNRLDGKPMQPVEMKHDHGMPSLSNALLEHIALGGKAETFQEHTEH